MHRRLAGVGGVIVTWTSPFSSRQPKIAGFEGEICIEVSESLASEKVLFQPGVHGRRRRVCGTDSVSGRDVRRTRKESDKRKKAAAVVAIIAKAIEIMTTTKDDRPKSGPKARGNWPQS